MIGTFLKAKFMKRHFVIWETLSFWFEKLWCTNYSWNETLSMIWSLHEAFWHEILRYETFWFETWFKLKIYHVKPNGMTLHDMTNYGFKFHAVKFCDVLFYDRECHMKHQKMKLHDMTLDVYICNMKLLKKTPYHVKLDDLEFDDMTP